MTDKEIYQLIEDYKEDSDALYERIHEQVESSIVQHAQAKKKRKKILSRVFSFATAFVLIVTLAIVLPIVLHNDSGEEVIRYSDLGVLKSERLNCTLIEYYGEHYPSGTQMPLCLDRYEYAEDIFTWRYYEEGKQSETVYLYESFMDIDVGYFIQLSVMRNNIIIDAFDEKLSVNESTQIDNIQILYRLEKEHNIAKFEYKGYKYYLELDDEVEKDFLMSLISSMINNNQQAIA